jgi:hypothetical protein
MRTGSTPPASTERWHHQQQIRLAVGRPGIMTPELYHPVLDCFMRALPHAYRSHSAPERSLLRFDVSGECGGSWFLLRDGGRWRLIDAPTGALVSHTTIPEDIAWRIFTKGIDRQTALTQVDGSGDRDLGLHVLQLVAIVA